MTLLFSVLLQIGIASCLCKFIRFKTILILSLFNFVRKLNPKLREKLEYLLLILVQRMCESLQVDGTDFQFFWCYLFEGSVLDSVLLLNVCHFCCTSPIVFCC